MQAISGLEEILSKNTALKTKLGQTKFLEVFNQIIQLSHEFDILDADGRVYYARIRGMENASRS